MANSETDRNGSDDRELDDFKRKRRLQLFGALAALLLIAGAVLLYVRHELPPERSVDQLMDRIQRCRMDVVETTRAVGGQPIATHELTTACREVIGKLIRRLPADCPKVLARIRQLESPAPANRLLNALLRYRRARFSSELTVPEFGRDRCIEDAVAHIHARHRAGAKGKGGLVPGLTDYNERLLRAGPNLVILAYLIDRLEGRTADRMAELVFARFRGQFTTRRADIKQALRRLFNQQIKRHFLKRHPTG